MTSALLPALTSTAEVLDARLRAVVDAHYSALWRFLRRLGIPEGQVEDATQQVLLVFAQRAADVAEDAERPFLFGTALRVASDARRNARPHQVHEVFDREAMLRQSDPRPGAEQVLEEKELRRYLDQILEELAPEQRAVFVLAELEELTMAEIGRQLSIPAGTVASRLRRARELVEVKARSLREQLAGGDDQ